jgi:cystathionine beta-lyase
MRPLAATYLAWLDLREYAVDDPAALALEKGRVKLEPGHRYQHGLPGHVRLNLATSADRLGEIVWRLASSLLA